MFVFCKECLTHFDDSCQDIECKGFTKGHPKHLRSDPAVEHVVRTREAWSNHHSKGLLGGQGVLLDAP